MTENPVSTKRLIHIMAANFIAAAFVAAPFGLILWAFLFLNTGLGASLQLVSILYVGWSLSWGLFSAGRAWQENREDVSYPAPMRQVLNKIGLNGETEYFFQLLYLPGVQVPDCQTSQPLL